MTRWLITGARGMLGRDLEAAVRARGDDVVALDHAGLDIVDAAAVQDAIDQHQPDVVVNCAAWTDVDGAESDEAAARRVNGDGPAHLATACRDRRTRLIQLSTDYVFRGDASSPYDENAATDPVNAYGRTKQAGEAAVLETLPDTGYVVRTAWLYGEHGPNFVRTMLRLERERETVDVVDDQRGQPTWTVDVAGQLLALADRDAPAGVYHATSSGETTWFGLTRHLYELLGADPERVRPTTSAQFVRPAPRPAYSVLGHDAWAACGIAPIRHWRDALRDALERLAPPDQALDRSSS